MMRYFKYDIYCNTEEQLEQKCSVELDFMLMKTKISILIRKLQSDFF